MKPTTKKITEKDVKELTRLAEQCYYAEFNDYRAFQAQRRQTGEKIVIQPLLVKHSEQLKEAKKDYAELILQLNLQPQTGEILYKDYQQLLNFNKKALVGFLENNPYAGIKDFKPSKPNKNLLFNKFNYNAKTFFNKFLCFCRENPILSWIFASVVTSIVVFCVPLLGGAIAGAIASGIFAVHTGQLLGTLASLFIIGSSCFFITNSFDNLATSLTLSFKEEIQIPLANDEPVTQTHTLTNNNSNSSCAPQKNTSRFYKHKNNPAAENFYNEQLHVQYSK